MKKLYWIPRVLAIFYILFLGFFAFEESLFSIAFFVQLFPAFIVLIFTLIAFKKNNLGALLFFILGIATIFFFSTWNNLQSFLLLSLPLIAIGGLFFVTTKKYNNY